jgi:hypothetical protein
MSDQRKDTPIGFVKSGGLPAEVVEARLKSAPTPYEKHLWQQPLLMDFLPRTQPVADENIGYFRAATEAWLEEEKRLRAIWRASPDGDQQP